MTTRLSILFFLACATACSAQAIYNGCPLPAQSYQQRYEKSGLASDLYCFETALERELTGSTPLGCPLTSQRYQKSYQHTGSPEDLTCFQEALQRELK